MVKIITVYGNMLLTAMGRTLLLAFLGLVFACILGMIFGLLSVLKNKACNIISNIFVFVIRGVPMIYLIGSAGRNHLSRFKLWCLYG